MRMNQKMNSKIEETSDKKEEIIKTIKEFGNKTKKVVRIVAKELISRTKKAVKIIREWKAERAQKKREQEEAYMKQIILTPEEIEELESAAYVMSRKWMYHKLMQAADLERAKIEGREVHGYMMRMFGHRYEWLIRNDVFDLAVSFAFKYHRPEVFNIIKDWDFDNIIINVIILSKKTNFDIFPEFDFDKFIVLTQGESFENAVHWIENHPWVDERGYNTTKTLAPCNFLNMGFPLWDLPVTVLKDAVGKDKLFFEAKTTADQIIDVREQILKKHIYKKRQDERNINEKLLEANLRFEQLEERHQYLIDDIKAGDTRNPEEKLKEFAKKYEKEISHTSNYKKVILGLIIVLLVIFIVMGIVSMYAPRTEIPEVPNTAITLLLYMFSRGC